MGSDPSPHECYQTALYGPDKDKAGPYPLSYLAHYTIRCKVHPNCSTPYINVIVTNPQIYAYQGHPQRGRYIPYLASVPK